MLSNCIINSGHFVKPSHKEKTLGHHTITSWDSFYTVLSHLLSGGMDPNGLQKVSEVTESCCHEHYETAGKLICVCLLLQAWHYNRKSLTTWRFGQGHYEVIQRVKDRALIYCVSFRRCILAFYKRQASEGDR